MSLSIEQQEQIDLQLKEHNHNKYEVNIQLSDKEVLNGLIVHPNVLRPEITTAQYLAKWLFENKELYQNKVVIDIGSGTGIQGVITGLYGARQVIFSDISEEAVKNTEENVTKFNLSKKARILTGDLFEKINDKADLIIFNHPFFPEEPTKDNPILRAMVDSGDLIHRFFKDAKKFLNTNGKIIMPYFHMGGDINNPAIQAPKHDYTVVEKLRVTIAHGLTLQKGEVSIYEIQ